MERGREGGREGEREGGREGGREGRGRERGRGRGRGGGSYRRHKVYGVRVRLTSIPPEASYCCETGVAQQ